MSWSGYLGRLCTRWRQGLLCRWDKGDIHEWSAISYPNDLLEFVTAEFRKMKQRQAVLFQTC